MMKYAFLLIYSLSLAACSYIDDRIRTLSKNPDLLIGYQTVELREGVEPIVEIVFPRNSSQVNEEAITQISEVLNTQSYYIVEATAGGNSSDSQRIAKDRISRVISVLESFGISSNKIYVAEYSADKKGRRAYIYSVSY